MRELSISVTQAARRFADCINRVRYQGASFVLQKNGVPVARIVPIESTSGSDFERLAVSLREARMEAEEDAAAVEKLIAAPAETPKAPQPPDPLKRPKLNW